MRELPLQPASWKEAASPKEKLPDKICSVTSLDSEVSAGGHQQEGKSPKDPSLIQEVSPAHIWHPVGSLALQFALLGWLLSPGSMQMPPVTQEHQALGLDLLMGFFFLTLCWQIKSPLSRRQMQK